jgi:hypothetical protein
MELSSYDKQHIQNLIERLYLTASTVSRVADGDRTLSMVKADIEYIANELEGLVEEAWHLRKEEAVSKNLCEEFLWEAIPEIKQAPECEHEKVYAAYVLASNPPQTPWICKKCSKQGRDVLGPINSGTEYVDLLQDVINKVSKGGY